MATSACQPTHLLRGEGLRRVGPNAKRVEANVARVVVVAEGEERLVRRHPANLRSPDLGEPNGEHEHNESKRLLADDLREMRVGRARHRRKKVKNMKKRRRRRKKSTLKE